MGMRTKRNADCSMNVIFADIIERKMSVSEIILKRELTAENEGKFWEEFQRKSKSNVFKSCYKAVKKNAKNNKEENKMASMKETRNEQSRAAKNAQIERARAVAEKKKEETKSVDLSLYIKELQEEISKREAALEIVMEKESSIRRRKELQSHKVNGLRASLAEAEKQLEEVSSELDAVEEEEVNFMTSIEELENEMAEIRSKIEAEKIYLVAPEYACELPKAGKFFSNIQIDGVQEVNPKEQFIIKPDFQMMVDAGYLYAPKYMDALVFASLCKQFEDEKKSFEILYDESIESLLRINGILK